MKNTSDAVELIRTLEAAQGRWQQDLSYSAGQFVWEFYIGKYGLEKYIQLLTSLDGSTLNAGLMETIGLNKDQFYQDFFFRAEFAIFPETTAEPDQTPKSPNQDLF